MFCSHSLFQQKIITYLVGIVGSYSSAEIPKALSTHWVSLFVFTISMIIESVGSFMFLMSHLKNVHTKGTKTIICRRPFENCFTLSILKYMHVY